MGLFDFLSRKPPSRDQLEKSRTKIIEKLDGAAAKLEDAKRSGDALGIDRAERERKVWQAQLEKVEERLRRQ